MSISVTWQLSLIVFSEIFYRHFNWHIAEHVWLVVHNYIVVYGEFETVLSTITVGLICRVYELIRPTLCTYLLLPFRPFMPVIRLPFWYIRYPDEWKRRCLIQSTFGRHRFNRIWPIGSDFPAFIYRAIVWTNQFLANGVQIIILLSVVSDFQSSTLFIIRFMKTYDFFKVVIGQVTWESASAVVWNKLRQRRYRQELFAKTISCPMAKAGFFTQSCIAGECGSDQFGYGVYHHSALNGMSSAFYERTYVIVLSSYP